MLLLPPPATITAIKDLEVQEVVEGSEGVRTGLTPGCEEVVLTDARAGVEAEHGPWTDMAGREVTPAAAVGAAAAPVGAGVPDGGGDILPRTPAGPPRGKIIPLCSACTEL